MSNMYSMDDIVSFYSPSDPPFSDLDSSVFVSESQSPICTKNNDTKITLLTGFRSTNNTKDNWKKHPQPGESKKSKAAPSDNETFLEELCSSFKQLKEYSKKTTVECKKLKVDYDKKKSANEELKTRVNDLRIENENYKMQINELEDEVKNLKSKLDNLQENNKKINDFLDIINEKFNNFEQDDTFF